MSQDQVKVEKVERKKFDFGKFLDGVIVWMQTIGVKLPDTAAHTTKVVGSLIFSAIDIVSGALGLSWVFTQLTPVEFQPTAKLIAWGLSTAMFFVVRSLVDDGDGRWWSGPSLFGWLLNIIDSLIDASTAFILFGLGGFLLKPGIQAMKESIINMPFLGWFIWGLLFIISLTSEHWREAMKPAAPTAKQEDEKKDKKKDEKKDSAQPAEDPNFPEKFHIKFDANLHKAVTHPNAPNRRVIFAKDAKAGASPLGWCFANELLSQTPPPPPPPPATTH